MRHSTNFQMNPAPGRPTAGETLSAGRERHAANGGQTS